jgi:hypothetical protein
MIVKGIVLKSEFSPPSLSNAHDRCLATEEDPPRHLPDDNNDNSNNNGMA